MSPLGHAEEHAAVEEERQLQHRALAGREAQGSLDRLPRAVDPGSKACVSAVVLAELVRQDRA